MIVKSFIVPGLPHPLLAPEKSPAWGKLRKGFDEARREIEEINPDLILIFSTQWVSVIGHQIQTHPSPKFVHVDPEFHDLGTMPYEFKMNPQFGETFKKAAQKRGLHTRTVAYDGFPIDTGSVVALKLLNPRNIPASIVSCNMYSDRSETIILGKAAKDAVEQTGFKTVAIAVTGFSYRFFTEPFAPSDDRIYSQKDDEWNRKILEILGEGRLEDTSQLAREFSQQAQADSKMKGIWWLAGLMGQNNSYDGKVFEYQPIWGTGAAVISLTPSSKVNVTREYDEESTETFKGYDAVFSIGGAQGAKPSTPETSGPVVVAGNAPKPVGAYPHARKQGDLLFLSGVGPRDPKTNEVPGGPIYSSDGSPLPYDVEAQTRAVIANVKNILEASGSSLEKVVDVAVYLTDMKKDFKSFNKVYEEYFKGIQATRTTVEVGALPTPIAVEFKVIARQ